MAANGFADEDLTDAMVPVAEALPSRHGYKGPHEGAERCYPQRYDTCLALEPELIRFRATSCFA